MDANVIIFLLWMMIGMAAALAIQYFIWRASGHKILVTLLAFISTAQLVWITLYVLLGGRSVPGYNPYDTAVDFLADPKRLVAALLAVPAGCMIVVLGYRLVTRPSVRTPLQVTERCGEFPARLVCTLGAIGPALYYCVLYMPRIPLVTPVISYLHYSLFMVPFALGRYGRTFRTQQLVFLVVAVATAVIAASEGSRSLIFLPAAIFGCGWLSSMSPRRRALALGIVSLLAPLAFYASQLIEMVRLDVRTGGEAGVKEGLATIARSSMQEAGARAPLVAVASGVSRMVCWSNVVVCYVVPDRIPYRGLADLPEEIRTLARSTLFGASGTDLVEDQISQEVGQGSAAIYGFSISAGGTVPFPVTADLWQRDGFVGGILGGMILALLFLGCEAIVLRGFSNWRFLPVMLLAVLASAAYDRANTYGIVYTIRFTLTTIGLWIFIVLPWLDWRHLLGGRSELAPAAIGRSRPPAQPRRAPWHR